jgi:carbonic anhydrase
MHRFGRRFLRLSAVVVVAMAGCAGHPTAAPERAAPFMEAPTSADGAWQRLVDGNARFVAAETQSRELIHRREELASGQHPWAIVLACADSRVGPELVFDQSLGDLFVIRNAGNLADPIAIGSIEYAVEHFHCHLIVVLGHSSCGAVAAAVSGGAMPTMNLQAVVDRIQRGLRGMRPGDDPVAANVRQSAVDLLNDSPIVAKHVAQGDLTIVMAVYQLKTGQVDRLPH